jgi:hypothetical protein
MTVMNSGAAEPLNSSVSVPSPPSKMSSPSPGSQVNLSSPLSQAA